MLDCRLSVRDPKAAQRAGTPAAARLGEPAPCDGSPDLLTSCRLCDEYMATKGVCVDFLGLREVLREKLGPEIRGCRVAPSAIREGPLLGRTEWQTGRTGAAARRQKSPGGPPAPLVPWRWDELRVVDTRCGPDTLCPGGIRLGSVQSCAVQYGARGDSIGYQDAASNLTRRLEFGKQC